eukprot:927202-Alexandrium_andersonii.AAC.1
MPQGDPLRGRDFPVAVCLKQRPGRGGVIPAARPDRLSAIPKEVMGLGAIVSEHAIRTGPETEKAAEGSAAPKG